MERKASYTVTVMEICELDEEMWGGEEVPSEAQRVKNYKTIVDTINYIQSQEFRLTEDWMEEQKQKILQYRDWFPNYNMVDPEVEDETFRRKCQETETLIAHLSDCVMRKTTFSIKFYLLLLQHMKWLIDQEEQDDLMVEMMGSLGM